MYEPDGERLVRIETKVDALVKYHEESREEDKEMRKRITELEKMEAKLIGIGLAASFIFTLVFKHWL